MVKFIFYVTRPELFVQEINHITSLSSMHGLESVTITDQTQLLTLSTQFTPTNRVLLLFASSDEELEELVSIKEYFGNIPTILVLPDDNIETLQRGMLLNPLYFLAKHAELNQFSLAVRELCHIYEDHFGNSSRNLFFHSDHGAVS